MYERSHECAYVLVPVFVTSMAVSLRIVVCDSLPMFVCSSLSLTDIEQRLGMLVSNTFSVTADADLTHETQRENHAYHLLFVSVCVCVRSS